MLRFLEAVNANGNAGSRTCACQPGKWEFTLDFSRTDCLDTNILSDPKEVEIKNNKQIIGKKAINGITSIACTSSLFGLDHDEGTEKFQFKVIDSIKIREYESEKKWERHNENSQHRTKQCSALYEGPIQNGETIVYTSVLNHISGVVDENEEGDGGNYKKPKPPPPPKNTTTTTTTNTTTTTTTNSTNATSTMESEEQEEGKDEEELEKIEEAEEEEMGEPKNGGNSGAKEGNVSPPKTGKKKKSCACLPAAIQVQLYGKNQLNDPSEFDFTLHFSNDCQNYPLISAGDYIGPLTVTSVSAPPSDFCPLVKEVN